MSFRPAAVVLAFLAVPAFLYPQTPVDFSGTWKMDVSRSESAHQAVPTGPSTLNIEQTAANLTIETKTAPKDRAIIANEKLTYRLDGTEGTVSDRAGGSIVCRAHWDGAKLITETGRNLQGSTVTTRYTLSLDATGKELTVHKTLAVQHGYQDPGANNTASATDVFVKVGPNSRRAAER